MNRRTAVFAILLLGMPALSLAWGLPEASAIQMPPLILPHSASLELSNLSGLQTDNLTINDAGAASLDESSRFWGPGLKVSGSDGSAAESVLAGGAAGRYIAAWEEFPDKTYNDWISAQVFNEQGDKVGGKLQVATHTSQLWDPAAAMGPDGDSIVGWIHPGGHGAVMAQRYDRDGNKVGAAINASYSPEYRGDLFAAANSNGDYILAWRDDRGGGSHIRARIISHDGGFLSDDIEVTSGSSGEVNPAVAVDSRDRIYIAFERSGTLWDVLVQRLDSTGLKIGTPVAPAAGDVSRSMPRLCIDPWDNVLLQWTQSSKGGSGVDLYAQKFDPAGAAVGGISALVADPGNQYIGYSAYDPDGNLLVAWTDNRTGNNETYTKLLQRRGGLVRLLPTVVSDTAGTQDYVAGLVAAPDGEFMAMWSSYNKYNSVSSLYARPLRQAHMLSGSLVTGDFAVPQNMVRWSTLEPNQTIPNPATCSISYEYSANGGQNWTAVPSNGSLAGAPAAPLRFRARFSTIDNLTTPVLHGIKVHYVKNIPPSITLPAPMTVKKNVNVTIVSNATDADLFDQFGLTYKWTQTSGKNLTLVNATGQNLSFKADKAGTFVFRLVVNDGWNDSAPATITVKVTESKPAAKSGYEWTLVLGAAAVIAVAVRRKRLSA